MNEPLFTSIEDLVLHRSPMLLIKSVVRWDNTGIDVLVDPKDSAVFANERGEVPAWVGIEYMAQAISAYAGIVAKTTGEPLCIGFLLGTRKFSAQVASFKPHAELVVKVRELLRDETNLVLFACEIYLGDALVASAELKAIQPKNIDEVVAQFKQMKEGV